MNNRKQEQIGIKDYRGTLLHEGDVIKHPNMDEQGTVYWSVEKNCWRVMYGGDKQDSRLGLQVGERGMAVKVGSIYGTDIPIHGDIGTVGNCANCGVEFHIHKPIDEPAPMVWQRVTPTTVFAHDERILVALKEKWQGTETIVMDCRWVVDEGYGMPYRREIKSYFRAERLDGSENTIEYAMDEVAWFARVTIPSV